MLDLPVPRIRALATKFRTAIEATPRVQLPVSFGDFPSGSCGDATLLLAEFLFEQGCGRFDYMLGERGGRSHAWLQRDGLIVDITADQFPDMPHRVFVGSESPCHAAFEASAEHVADFNAYDQFTRGVLGGAYERVCAHLSNPDE